MMENGGAVKKLAGFALLLALSGLMPVSVSAQQVEYYHLDALGSVRAVTDASGAILVCHDYEPYGVEWNEPASTDTRRFTGKERDSESGLDYFGARYYSAPIARFTSTDPVYTWSENLTDPERWNRYAYGRNNPLRYVDPDGRELRTTHLQRMQEIAGPAAGKIQIVGGVLDVSAVQPLDLVGNEGAMLLWQLATSGKVYEYSEGTTIATADGVRNLRSGAENLDSGQDRRFPSGKQPTSLPPAGIDASVVIDPSVTYVDEATGTRTVSTGALAFHELAEAYGKVNKGLPYSGRFGSFGAHEDARFRELQLIAQRPLFTQFPAGGLLKR